METITSDNGDGSHTTYQAAIPDREWEQAGPPSGRIFGLPVAYESLNGKTPDQGPGMAVLAQTIIGSIIVGIGVLLGLGLITLTIAMLTLPLWR